MSNIKHRDVDITIEEGPKFTDPSGGTVDGHGKLVYKAGSKFGNTYSPKPDKALEDQKQLIDDHLDRED